ncbi:GTPase HflX, partial [Paenibacillus sepulcri]|nr:GTPase HflX [Paenibacillus sepulcri]
FLLTDTVGFVSRLPHHLVKAFRSTLEEVAEADLLIHVADYANPSYPEQIAVTEDTLKALGADQIPVIYAYNKTDLTIGGTPYPDQKDAVYLSVKQKSGIDELIALIRGHVLTDYIQCEVLIPFDQGQVVSYFNEHAWVQSTSYEEEGTRLKLECTTADFEKYGSPFLSR